MSDSLIDENEAMPDDLRREFDAAANRTVEQLMRYGFIKTYKPVMDDARFRAFDTMEEYRQWCEANLPSWLGHGRDRSCRDADDSSSAR